MAVNKVELVSQLNRRRPAQQASHALLDQDNFAKIGLKTH